MQSRSIEGSPISHPEIPADTVPRHIGIVIPPHNDTPWNVDHIVQAGKIASSIRDMAATLGTDRFTVYMEDLAEGELIKEAMWQQTEHFSPVEFTIRSTNGRRDLQDAYKKIVEDGIPPEDLTEGMLDVYLPNKPDLLIMTDEKRSHAFQLPGTVMDTDYTEFTTSAHTFLELTPDDLMEKYAEYRKRERPRGGKRK